MTIHKTSSDSYASVKPEIIAENYIYDAIVDMMNMLDMVNESGCQNMERLKAANKTQLKAIAAELDTVKKRLDYVLFGKY